jgi:hypothetical protein
MYSHKTIRIHRWFSVPTSRRDSRERRALNRERSTYDVRERQFHERGITAARPISRRSARSFQVGRFFPQQLQSDVTKTMHGARDCPLSIYETVKNDARTLLLTNARQDFHDRARYWRGDGDASSYFS